MFVFAKKHFSAAAVLFAFAAIASGQATRTWVSGVGDDANPCSRTAPCKTFAGAISKTAASGEIDVLDPGGFGAVTITKAITIDGTPVLAGVLVAGTNGITITAGTTDTVILRGLDINGLGGQGLDGVKITQAGQVLIEDSQIYGFNPRAISVEPTGANVQVFVSHTRLVDSASNGIVVSPTVGFKAQVTLNDVEISENANFGVSIVGTSAVVLRNSTVADNGVTSAVAGVANIRIDGTNGATLDLDNVVVSGGPIGIASLNGGIVRVNNSGILTNGLGLMQSGGTISSFGNNRLANTSNGAFSGLISLE
jgi:Right handed beta helix region